MASPKLKQFETLNSRQKDVLRDLLKHLNISLPSVEEEPLYQQGQQYLSGILSQSPEAMQQFEAPAMRQFNEEIVPGIAERFSGMGARNSSAFQQAMGQAGTGLAERLAAMRANLGMQATQQGLGYALTPFQQALQQQQLTLGRTGLGLGTAPFGYQAFQGTPGFGSSIAGGLGQGAGAAIGSAALTGLGALLGGPAGAAAGMAASSAIR